MGGQLQDCVCICQCVYVHKPIMCPADSGFAVNMLQGVSIPSGCSAERLSAGCVVGEGQSKRFRYEMLPSERLVVTRVQRTGLATSGMNIWSRMDVSFHVHWYNAGQLSRANTALKISEYIDQPYKVLVAGSLNVF
jgi:hypothetical protein